MTACIWIIAALVLPLEKKWKRIASKMRRLVKAMNTAVTKYDRLSMTARNLEQDEKVKLQMALMEEAEVNNDPLDFEVIRNGNENLNSFAEG